SSFNAVFGVTQETGVTLLSALSLTGGGLNGLAQQGVAALLNAANPHISHAFTPAQVIAMVQAAFQDSGLVASATGLFAAQNNLGAPMLPYGSGAATWSVQYGEGLPSSYWVSSSNFAQWTGP